MYDRAPRLLRLAEGGSTEEHVGPGSYQVPVLKQQATGGYAPFLSLATRESTFTVASSTEKAVPGPGHYNVSEAQYNIKGGHSLQNREIRFKKFGSESPGPASYDQFYPGTLDTVKRKAPQKISRAPPSISRSVDVPSIPSCGRSYGYDINEDGGIIKHFPPASDSTLGPAYYKPKLVTYFRHHVTFTLKYLNVNFLEYNIFSFIIIMQHFLKEPYFLLIKNGISKQDQYTVYMHCYWDVINFTANPSQQKQTNKQKTKKKNSLDKTPMTENTESRGSPEKSLTSTNKPLGGDSDFQNYHIKNKHSFRDFWDIFKHTNICIKEIPEEEKKKKESKRMFEEITAKNISNLSRSDKEFPNKINGWLARSCEIKTFPGKQKLIGFISCTSLKRNTRGKFLFLSGCLFP
ncbi:unnamed protein product [Nyctereutes procyonoides]|uniref:(raccoon dog) hypothetical protein n=1 Tax=Nyctereutes procyonoides TaxID=34880 RepID=A0A811ZYE1_NYCPR|nr:unnamed protein product [Nyctereutes procyonoides]